MKKTELLREWIKLDYSATTLKESRDKNNGRVVLSGCIQKAEVKNANGRVYPRHILQREVENYMKAVRENRAVGQLDHPQDAVISLEKASHIMREIWWEGNDVCGRLEFLSTPNGRIAESLLESGVVLGISSRGVGSTEQTNEGNVVQDDFSLVCWDLVGDASTPGAYLQTESKNYEAPKFSKADRIFRALNAIVLR